MNSIPMHDNSKDNCQQQQSMTTSQKESLIERKLNCIQKLCHAYVGSALARLIVHNDSAAAATVMVENHVIKKLM